MSATAIVLILAAAVAHASWNLLSKQASATGAAFFLWLLAACATVAYLPVAAIAMALSREPLTLLNWVFLAGTGMLHSGYFLFLQLGYRTGDLSVAYPIGRGTGALLAAVAGVVLLGERPGPVGACGVAAIISGVVVIGLPERRAAAVAVPAGGASAAGLVLSAATPGPAGLAASADLDSSARPDSSVSSPAGRVPALSFALVTGLFISCYTIWDKYAVATLHTPPVLQGYAGLPVMVLVFTPVVLRDRDRLGQVWRDFRPQVLGAAVLSPLAYMLVLVALSFTAVSAVAPAREISVLLGVLLGRRLLGEGNVARRLGAAAAIVAGIIAIAVG